VVDLRFARTRLLQSLTVLERLPHPVGATATREVHLLFRASRCALEASLAFASPSSVLRLSAPTLDVFARSAPTVGIRQQVGISLEVGPSSVTRFQAGPESW
jgi:hypothetical protein